jgi:NH3-dependent NAD+ synthetase
MDYATLDRVLWRLEQGGEVDEVAAACGIARERVAYVRMLIRRSESLRRSPRVPAP